MDSAGVNFVIFTAHICINNLIWECGLDRNSSVVCGSMNSQRYDS